MNITLWKILCVVTIENLTHLVLETSLVNFLLLCFCEWNFTLVLHALKWWKVFWINADWISVYCNIGLYSFCSIYKFDDARKTSRGGYHDKEVIHLIQLRCWTVNNVLHMHYTCIIQLSCRVHFACPVIIVMKY